MDKLEKIFGGIKEMKNASAMFVVDPRKERIAIAEAKAGYPRSSYS